MLQHCACWLTAVLLRPCRDMQAALLVYDVTSRASFEALPAWLEEACKGGAGSMVGTAAARLSLCMCGARRAHQRRLLAQGTPRHDDSPAQGCVSVLGSSQAA